jgi:F-type H+-transporting ATPase subunit b
MDILNISWQALVAQIIAFLLLIWVMKKYLFGPVGDVLEARQKEVQGTIDQIAADRRAMERMKAEYEQRIAGVEAEAREHIQAAIKEAQSLKDEIVNSARGEAERIVTRGREEINRDKNKALAELRAEVADLAIAVASRVIGQALDERVHRELIHDFVNQVGAS